MWLIKSPNKITSSVLTATLRLLWPPRPRCTGTGGWSGSRRPSTTPPARWTWSTSPSTSRPASWSSAAGPTTASRWGEQRDIWLLFERVSRSNLCSWQSQVFNLLGRRNVKSTSNILLILTSEIRYQFSFRQRNQVTSDFPIHIIFAFYFTVSQWLIWLPIEQKLKLYMDILWTLRLTSDIKTRIETWSRWTRMTRSGPRQSSTSASTCRSSTWAWSGTYWKSPPSGEVTVGL